MKKKADLIIINSSQLVTCRSGGKAKKGSEMRDLGIIDDGAVAVSEGRIVAVGTSKEILHEYDVQDVLNAEGKAVCPGFVEPHTHLVSAGNRLNEFEQRIGGVSYLEIMKSGGGIMSTVAATRKATVEELVETGRRRLDVMLHLGITTCEIKTGYGLTLESELKILEAIEILDQEHIVEIIPTFLPAHAIPPEWKGKEDEFTEYICGNMLLKAADWYKNSSIASKNRKLFIDVFCEQNVFNLKQTQTIIDAAVKLGYGVKAHVDEFTNLGAAEFAIEKGAVSIDHLDATSDRELKMLAASETVGVITPAVNFNLASQDFADARKMIDMGCAIALSTDNNPGSAPCFSQTLSMAIATRYQKLLPSEAFNAITINAAAALGLAKTHGSIEVGKEADILILDATDYRETAFEFGRSFVNVVIKKGRLLDLQ